MGCGASAADQHVDEPAPPQEDPLQDLLKQIAAERGTLQALLPELAMQQHEGRYLRTTVLKLGVVTKVMQANTEEEKELLDSLKQHVAHQDALDIREASEGLGTDEEKMGRVVVARLKENLDLTDAVYQKMFNRSLEDQIRGENKTLLGLLTGSMTDFGKFLTYRCMEPAKRDAFLLHKAMCGAGCSDYILVEILSTRTNAQLQAVAAAYAAEHDAEDLRERIKGETGGFGKQWYGKWVDSLVDFDRDECKEISGDPCELAQQLYDAGAGKWMGCDEQVFIDVLCKANAPTCKAIAQAYEELGDSKNTLAEDVAKEMGGDLEFAVLARVRSTAEFLAVRIYKACKGWGTDEECIGRVISCCNKSQSKDLEEAYNRLYANEEPPFDNMRSLLSSELSGSFLDIMFVLLDSFPPKGHNTEECFYGPHAEEAAAQFRAQVAEVYDPLRAARKGEGTMDGPLLLCDVDGALMQPGYDFPINPPCLPYQEKDTSHLFGEDPQDIDNAQQLLGKLKCEILCTQISLQEICDFISGAKPTYEQRAEELRRVDHYLHQICNDNVNMLEFCAQRDADTVHEATEGWGTDEDKLIRVLCALSKPQLRRVDEIYKDRYGKSLRMVTDQELGGLFEGQFKFFMKCALTPAAELDAELLKESMAGWGTDDTLLCELVCTRSNKEMLAAQLIFEQQEGTSLLSAVQGDTSRPYQQFLLRCLRADRDEVTSESNSPKASADAQRLHDAGLGGGDVDPAVLQEVLAVSSVEQVQAIRRAYKDLFDKELTEAIKETLAGDWERVLLARVLDKPTYYATTLHNAFKGFGTDENAISRILGRSSKREIREIAARYEELYEQTLHNSIQNECSGHFRAALLQMIFSEAPSKQENDVLQFEQSEDKAEI